MARGDHGRDRPLSGSSRVPQGGAVAADTPVEDIQDPLARFARSDVIRDCFDGRGTVGRGGAEPDGAEDLDVAGRIADSESLARSELELVQQPADPGALVDAFRQDLDAR